MKENNWKTTNQAMISRLKAALGVGLDTDLAKFLGIKSQGITRAKTKGIPNAWVDKVVASTGVSLGWIIVGAGEMKKNTDNIEGVSERAESKKEINVHEGVMMTTKVLSSNTGYANALWHNLKSFDAAVDREAEVGEMKEMMARLAEDNRVMMEKMERMEKAIVAPEGDTKKRDKAANS